MTLRTANELAEEGRRLRALGNMVVFLHPNEEWLAVREQMPFLRLERIPVNGEVASNG